MASAGRPGPTEQQTLAWVTAGVAALALVATLAATPVRDLVALPRRAALSESVVTGDRETTNDPTEEGRPAAGEVPTTSSPTPGARARLAVLPVPTTPDRPAPIRLAWGVTTAELTAGRADARAMTLDQVVGQVIVATYPGPAPATASALVTRLHLAGVILMGGNVVDAAQVRATTAAVHKAVRADGRSWPAFIAVDQEGGPVARLGDGFTVFPAFMSAGAAADVTVVRAAARASGTELRAAGFTVDLAPVADVTIGPADPVIGVRSASGDPRGAAAAVVAAQRGYREVGMLTAVKHFPGHGSVTVDSHVAIPVQSRSLDVLRRTDLVPFQEAIDAGAPMVMLGHIVVPAVDPVLPATLSPAAYGLLRHELGFTGVTITDALDMGAVTGQRVSGQVALEAMRAGADLLLMPGDAAEAHAALVAAVKAGTLSRARLDQAAGRVIAMMRLNAEERRALGPVKPATIRTSAAASRALSAAAVTVVRGPCAGALVGSRVAVAGGTDQDRALFVAAALRAGLAVVAPERSGVRTVILIDRTGRVTGGDIAVALDAPFALAGSNAPVRIALYGRTPGAFEALIAVLTGRAPARGHLPVAVGDLPAGSGCPA